MIVKKIRGDIFSTVDRHIVFALNIEGINDSGFAGQVARIGFSEILNTNGKNVFTREDLSYGMVISKEIKGKTYHGIVCHSLRSGWNNAERHILKGLNQLNVQEPMSVVLIGAGLIGQIQGAPIKDILWAFKECNKELTVYTL